MKIKNIFQVHYTYVKCIANNATEIKVFVTLILFIE